MFTGITDENLFANQMADIRYSQTRDDSSYTATRIASKDFTILGVDADNAEALAAVLRARYAQTKAVWYKSSGDWTKDYLLDRSTEVVVTRKSYQSCEIAVNVSETDTVVASSRFADAEKQFDFINNTRSYFDGDEPSEEYCPLELTGEMYFSGAVTCLGIAKHDPTNILLTHDWYVEFLTDGGDSWLALHGGGANDSVMMTSDGKGIYFSDDSYKPLSTVWRWYRMRTGSVSAYYRYGGAKAFRTVAS